MKTHQKAAPPNPQEEEEDGEEEKEEEEDGVEWMGPWWGGVGGGLQGGLGLVGCVGGVSWVKMQLGLVGVEKG